MATLTISLTPERMAGLMTIAQRLGISTEDLARAGVESLLAGARDDFEAALEHVLRKNAELYRRLA